RTKTKTRTMATARARPKVKTGRFASKRERALAQSVGAILLDLRSALRRAERCRLKLSHLGYSQQRWQEIVREVDPELRFMVRPKTLDAIVAYLRSEGKPVDRESLVRVVAAQRGGEARRIRQSVTANLHNQKLALYAENKIGLPQWKHKS
ncbi:MAG TPA: hypothetical protein VFW31_11535, partial [Candidatus Angelobacter sp.]|nr:hypothetical protein [Candidatus Angelobacter sp.]